MSMPAETSAEARVEALWAFPGVLEEQLGLSAGAQAGRPGQMALRRVEVWERRGGLAGIFPATCSSLRGYQNLNNKQRQPERFRNSATSSDRGHQNEARHLSFPSAGADFPICGRVFRRYPPPPSHA